ncbi:hypothetical protein BBP40_011268 [Aspergillus hancockii]|nr:hypothetical protein BBP40_011268 [Aspergillus hancockii]
MRIISILFLASHTLATWHKPLPAHQSHNFNHLISWDSGNCTVNTTCSECYGAGNIFCDNAGRFNPECGKQCCKDGYSCVAWDNSCCQPLGTGTSGTDGVVPRPSATASSTTSQLTTISCTAEQTNDECCSQNGLYSLRWCVGEYPNQECYNPKRQTCCSDGAVCHSMPSTKHSSSDVTATTGSKAEATNTATQTSDAATTASASENAGIEVTTGKSGMLGVVVAMLGLLLQEKIFSHMASGTCLDNS